MSITSLTFLLFLLAALIVYYAVPKRFQWIVLLAASVGFYLSCGVKSALYVLVTATTIYAAARLLQRMADAQKAYLRENKGVLSREEKAAYKARVRRKRRAVLLAALLLNLGLLCVFKYFHFALAQINAVAALFGGRGIEDRFRLIVPLGISFYTFQAIGYLVDVYWEHCGAERNYAKVLLFVCFFPQMTQGPISDFAQLSGELFREHSFAYRNYARGFQRLLWGFLKKMALADLLAPLVSDVFAHYNDYPGVTVLIGAFLYSVQIYADFSGYMDIMCGYCEMLDIRLTENFERPYFSKSVAEYWRRWHISLGAWFKKYIYYPIGMSSWSRKLAKSSRARFGKHFADTMPATIALVVTWLATGLWHGASWAYAAWGLVNGLFIILSLWMEPVYAGWKARLRLDESAWLWRAFQTVRTFVLVTFIKVLPEVGTLADGWGLWKRILTEHTLPRSLAQLLPFVEETKKFALAMLMTAALFLVSLLQRRRPVRDRLEKIPLGLRIVLFAGLTVLLIAVASEAGEGNFLYAQF